MLWNASSLNGFSIEASDGTIGKVADLLFDDSNFNIRWLVVETGGWFSSKKVILPVSNLGKPNRELRVFPVNLTKQMVKDSPDLDFDAPVSRQIEARSLNYYGWEPYMGGALFPMSNAVAASMLPHEEMQLTPQEREIHHAKDRGDPHLRSAVNTTGYHLHAKDGEIGHILDFLVDDQTWSIRYIAVDNNNWWPGKISLILPRSIGGINWLDKMVFLTVDRQKVKDAPEYHASITVDGAYDEKFANYYYPPMMM